MSLLQLASAWDRIPDVPVAPRADGFMERAGFLCVPGVGLWDMAERTPAFSAVTALTLKSGLHGIGGYPTSGTGYANTGPTNFSRGYTLFAVCSASGTAYEAIMDDDPGATRGFQFRFTNTGAINFIPFTEADGFVSVASNNYSAAELAAGVPVVARVDASGNIAVFGKGGKFTGSLGAAPRIPGNVPGNLGVRFFRWKGGGNQLTKPLFMAGALNRVVSDAEAWEFLRNPVECVFGDDVIWLFTANGGAATHNLEGAAAAQSSATAVLTHSVPVAGAAVGLASAVGDLSVSSGVALGGNATVQPSSSAGLSLLVPFSAAAIVNAIAAAQLALAKPLAGVAAGQSAAPAAMTISISLAGSAIALAAASAGLTVSTGYIKASADAVLASSAGVLASGLETGVDQDLAGNAAAQSSGTGALTHAVPLSGAALTVSSADGSLTHIVPLSGAASAASLATGGLDITVNLDADALAQAMASAGLTVSSGATLSGSAIAQAAASGTLTLRVNLDGAAVANAIAAGALDGTGTLTGSPGYKVELNPRTWRVSRAARTWRIAA